MGDKRETDLLQGTLDMLILKALSLGPLHGYGVLLRIQQISGEELVVQQGSLYPALYRLEHQGNIASEWGESENNRKAKYYQLHRPWPRTPRVRNREVEADGRDYWRNSGGRAREGLTAAARVERRGSR